MKLTNAQLQIYNMEGFAGGAVANVCGSLLLNGKKDLSFLKEKVNMLFELNDGLRVQMYEKKGEILQRFTPYEAREIKSFSFDNYDDFCEFAADYAKIPLDTFGSLCEICVVTLPDKFGIIPKLHHLIGDAWAIALLGSQFNALVAGETPPAFSLEEYIKKENEYLFSKRYVKDAEFFEKKLLEFDEPVYLSSKPSTSFLADRESFVFDKSLSEKITNFSEQNGISAFSFFLTALFIHLGKSNLDAEHICIGAPIINRSGMEEKYTVGSFVNSVPIFADIDYNKSFIETAESIEAVALSSIRHQKYNYQVTLDSLRAKGHTINKPYDLSFSYQTTHLQGDFAESTWLHNGMQVESILIHTEDRNNEGFYKIHYDYQTEKFSKTDIFRLHNRLSKIINTAIQNKDIALKDINIALDEELEKIKGFNNTFFEYDNNKCIYQLLKEQATKNPEKKALIFKDNILTYKDLIADVELCADRLSTIGVEKNDIVAIHLDRSHKLVIFQLAVLKIGAQFLPVDKRYPKNRIEFMFEDCAVKLLISDEFKANDIAANIINLEQFESLTPTAKSKTVTDQDNCYIIYTSGSTGKPKGCILCRKGLVNFCKNNNTLETLENIDECIFASVNSVSFDYFIAESLLPLTNGYTTVILDDTESTVQKHFLESVKRNNINVVMTTPTRLKIYFDDTSDCKTLEQLKCICTSGEPLTASLLQKMYEKSPAAQIYNPIGPSECSVWDMGGRLEKSAGLDIHIGKPIANAQIHIVDKYLNLVPIGVTGEICIAGDGVGAGYINNPELTAEKFVDNPFGDGKLYKTGDLAYWREDGNICYVGRNDFQVKVRGLRIELGEIENTITNVDGVIQCTVIVRKDSNNEQYICAFYTGKEYDVQELRSLLAAKLPRYMVPHIFINIEKMPLTSTGKIDRRSLPEVDFNSINTDIEFVAPETAEEKALADAIGNVLSQYNVSMLDNFFNIGGDSIRAIHIVSHLEKQGYELHVADIMQSETLADVAKAITSASHKAMYEQVEVTGFIPFSPIMRAMLKESKEIPINFVQNSIISVDCDEFTAKKAFDTLTSHHDILRGQFTENGIIIRPSGENIYSFAEITIDDEAQAKEHLAKTELEDNKLVNVIFCKTANANLLSITIHHFLVDLVSWELLINDFKTVVEQIKNNEQISLPAKTASFKLWSEELQKYSEEISEETKIYWSSVNEKLNNSKPLYAYAEENDAEKYTFDFDKLFTDKLINVANKTYGTRTQELLLTALGRAAGSLAHGNAGIIVESHGRTDLNKPISTSHTVGWFTSCYPVVIDSTANLADALIDTKETMRRISRNGIDYLLLSDGFHKNTDVIFNFYQNNGTNSLIRNGLIGFNADTSLFPGKISVDCTITNDALSVSISVPQGNHKAQLSRELGDEFKNQIEDILALCTATDTVVKTLSDFSDDKLTRNELNEINNIYANDDIQDIYELTAAQAGIYAQYFRSNDTRTYHLQGLCKISKQTDLNLLQKSVDLLACRHMALKTSFTVLKTTGEIKQIILKNRTPEFTVLTQNIPFSQKVLDHIVEEDSQASLDLQRDSLFSVTIVDFTDERFMIIHAHHIILDGWCLPLIIGDLQEYYAKLSSGTSEERLADEINKVISSQTSYAQYVNWLNNQNTSEALGYWKELLAGSSPSHIFGKENKDNEKSDDIITFRTPLGDELSQRIEQFAKENKISTNSVFECAFSIALQKFSNSDDVMFNKVVSGRSTPLKNIENTVGLFINTIPVRIKNDGNCTLAEALKQTHSQTAEADRYGLLPLAEIHKSCDIDARKIDALFVFENYYTGNISDMVKGALSPEFIAFNEQTEFNLTVTIIKDNGYTIRTSYARDMYTQNEIDSFVNGYISLFNSVLHPDVLVKDINILTENDRQLLGSFNETSHTYDVPEEATLYSLFEKASEENKEKVCLKANGKEMRFFEFKEYAERMDAEVRAITKSEKSVIAVICERSLEMYGAVYGIIRGGNAYLPIDPNYPQDRIDYILENSGAKAAITQDKFCHLAGNVPCINATELLNSNKEYEATECLATEDDTAYVIYTSGSTGNPKGARISHKSAVNRILWMHDFYPLEENDVILQKTPYTFDVSVWELFWWGVTGRCLAASKPDEHFLPAKILEEIHKNSVTHLHFVPSVFDLFLTYIENNPQEQNKFNSVKYVFLSGEALTANHINRFYKIYDFNKVKLHNLYGPTECAVDVSYYPCVPTDVDPVPIGKPIYNTQLHIVDKNLNLVPLGVTGELCIAGVNVGQGYLNNTELIAEKFVDNPFGDGKLYKTGDLAYWREDGNIIYCGRMDNQVKLNGQRIELGEIENVINSIEGIDNAAVIVRTVDNHDILVAFCCGEIKDSNIIREFCIEKLPRYMIPQSITFLEKLPLNQSGKLDRKKLKFYEITKASNEFETPQNETEKLICKLFAEALKIDKIGRNHNFFDYGGTSLSMISILSEDIFKEFSAAEFIENPTPAKLSEALLSRKHQDFEYVKPLYEPTNTDKALILFPFAGGGAESYALFKKAYENISDSTALYFVEYLHSEEEISLAAKEVSLLSQNKKIYFYSHCAGAAVAMSIINTIQKYHLCNIEHYVAGGFIPQKNPVKRNWWNFTPDSVLKKILVNAGAALNKQSTSLVKKVLHSFRSDTNYMVEYFANNAVSLNCPVSLVISKNDPFTKNYAKAKELWSKYAQEIKNVVFIESSSHYFQSANAEALAHIIKEIL